MYPLYIIKQLIKTTYCILWKYNVAEQLPKVIKICKRLIKAIQTTNLLSWAYCASGAIYIEVSPQRHTMIVGYASTLDRYLFNNTVSSILVSPKAIS